MWFWWFMLLSDLLLPAILIISGRMMWKHCPRRINPVIGYRTKRSMKNMDTWQFAHNHCGRLWWKTGWIMLFPSILVHIPFLHGADNTIGTVGGIICTIQCIILIISIFHTEYALKKTFFDDGTRR